jgi:hypothetical protein
MSMADLDALFRAVRTKLIASPQTTVESRVYTDVAPESAARPYIIVSRVSGGAEPSRLEQAEYVLQVKAVADDYDTAATLAGEIADRLDDQGTQDRGVVTPLDGGVDWIIVSSTRGLAVQLTEQFAGKQPIYHFGYRFRFRMEAR